MMNDETIFDGLIGNSAPHLFVIEPRPGGVHLLLDVPEAAGHLRLTILNRAQVEEVVSALLAAADQAWPEEAPEGACAFCGRAVLSHEAVLSADGLMCADCLAGLSRPVVGGHD